MEKEDDKVFGKLHDIISHYPNLGYKVNNDYEIPEIINDALRTLEEKSTI